MARWQSRGLDSLTFSLSAAEAVAVAEWRAAAAPAGICIKLTFILNQALLMSQLEQVALLVARERQTGQLD